MGISNHDYQQMLVRTNSARKKKDPAPEESRTGVSKESHLHDDIIAECRRRGWLYFHGSMAHRTHKTLGEPDITIIGSLTETWEDGTGPSKVPRVWFIECKTRTGKLTQEQNAVIHHAASHGITIHVVRSMAEFLEVIK